MAISRKLTDDELIEKYLEPDPNTGDPAEWRLKERGVPVWVLIAYLLPDASNAGQVMSDYQISRASMAAAQAYYRRNKWIIDAWNLSNSTA